MSDDGVLASTAHIRPEEAPPSANIPPTMKPPWEYASAAEEIDALRAEVDRLRAALREIAEPNAAMGTRWEQGVARRALEGSG